MRLGEEKKYPDRRDLLAVAAAASLVSILPNAVLGQEKTLRFGLTPVFRSDDLELLELLQSFLQSALGSPVVLVARRTYQEITSLLVSGQIQAAWICGYPYLQYREELSLVAVPVWRGKPLYQSYLIANEASGARSLDDFGGKIHAFSDPDSNSGYLVTAAELAQRGLRPETYFRKTFFTYGHRNVIRAVASGLAHSGSVDGYVWEAVAQAEPDLAAQTKVISKSEWLGFPPIACPKAIESSELITKLRSALTGTDVMGAGAQLLDRLKLDGFAQPTTGLYSSIAQNAEIVRRLG